MCHFLRELSLMSERYCCLEIPSKISVRRVYILTCGFLGLVFVMFPYQFLINCEIISYAVTTLLFFFSFYKIRYYGHDSERPGWKIPGGVVGLIIFTGTICKINEKVVFVSKVSTLVKIKFFEQWWKVHQVAVDFLLN